MISPDTVLANRYRLVSRLGGGGHGEVWRAHDLLLDRIVAVKTIRAGLADDPEFAARFHAEARSMATIDHPGVVAVFDFGIAELSGRRTPYLVMQYLDGEPLHLLLSRGGRIPAGAAMDLVAQTAEALQAAHDAGVVHRDVKPGNLVIRPDGSVVLTDFGIARSAGDGKLTATGIVLGTVVYCAPEQAEGAAPSTAMDVYALGVVAYECLTGQVPFQGENAVAIALKHVNEAPAPLPAHVPAAVGEVVMRALAKDPADRWPSAGALAAAARALTDRAAPGPSLADRAAPGPSLADRAAPGPWLADRSASGPSLADRSASGPPFDDVPDLSDRSDVGDHQDLTPPSDRRDRSATGSSPMAGRSGSGERAPVGGRATAGGAAVSGTGTDRATLPAPAGGRRVRRWALSVGAGFVATAIAATAAWNLLGTDHPESPASQAQAGPTPPIATDPSPDLLTHTRDDDHEPRERPTTPAPVETTPETGPSEDPSPPPPAEGVLVGGIVHSGGPSSGDPEQDGYQPGQVDVFTGKGKRVASRRADRRGFRFSLPRGGYRLQTAVAGRTCSTTARVTPDRTTRADLTCSVPEPGFRSAAVKDVPGDVKGGPDSGETPPYADLLVAAANGGQDGVTLAFVTGGPIPGKAPSGKSQSRWAVSIEQDAKTFVLSFTGRDGAWSAAWTPATGPVAAKPVISGAGISVAFDRAQLKTAPVDFTQPYRISHADANVTIDTHTWTDSTP
ncbi:serine/threonine-protein kinase [Nonomuraea fuscirosea]|uniref:serine/threonine-protein kinase n=1 Tax=Nonomuraea fuscirosea TaxID=1291556 RepID=UPI0034073EC6